MKTVEATRREKLVSLIAEVGSQSALSEKIGKSPAQISQWVNASANSATGKPRVMSNAIAREIEVKMGRPEGWMDQSEESIRAGIDGATVIQNDTSDVVIKEYDTGGSMGRGLVLAEQPGVIKEWRVSDRWAQENVHRVTSYKNLAIVTGFGPSMQPLFNPGDPLLVDCGIKRADIDGIYFFRVGDEGFVKQLQRIPTASGLILRAKSYNTLYDSFDITRDMDLEIFARVVKVWKGEEF